ncbi:uncharacterized protein LOC120766032 isoform X4 [Hirundo rustica]|uniref:uncharacterized protein LOC120766032 isoform X4 n=1 Tax=Hirundo rustica TaxID=43150 RepID=UPI0026738A04|nr:uncharacterized protein LOC120766032 isoform X4 [Hirundo rustica]
MPGIHLDVWGTTWLCEKAREGSRLPPEVRLVCKLASKAKASASQGIPGSPHGVSCHAHVSGGRRGICALPSWMRAVSKLWRSCRRLLSSNRGILHPESTRWRCQSPPFLPPQPVSPVGQVALQQVACLEASARAELGRRYLLKEEKSSKTCDSSIRQQRAPSTRKESSLQDPWLLTVRLSSSAVLGSTTCLPSFHWWV